MNNLLMETYFVTSFMFFYGSIFTKMLLCTVYD